MWKIRYNDALMTKWPYDDTHQEQLDRLVYSIAALPLTTRNPRFLAIRIVRLVLACCCPFTFAVVTWVSELFGLFVGSHHYPIRKALFRTYFLT